MEVNLRPSASMVCVFVSNKLTGSWQAAGGPNGGFDGLTRLIQDLHDITCPYSESPWSYDNIYLSDSVCCGLLFSHWIFLFVISNSISHTQK